MKKRIVQLETTVAEKVLLNNTAQRRVLVVANEAEWRMSNHHQHHVFYCSQNWQVEQCCPSLVADLTELPVRHGAIDILILPHVLLENGPMEQWLAQIDDVLTAQGQLLIFGINDSQQCSADELKQLFKSNGYQVLKHRGYHLLPVLGADLSRVADFCLGQFFPWLANSYWLLLQKQVYSVTPLKVKWRRSSALSQRKARPIAGSFNNEVVDED